jgi:hypothetical protein
MKGLVAAILASLILMTVGALGQGPNELNAGSQMIYSGSSGTFSWWGVAGSTYLIQTSDDLVNWSYLPVVESGSNSIIEWGFTSNSSSLFMKLEYITVTAGQLTGTVFNGPLDSSSGLPGDWELFYFGQLGVNPNAYVPWSGGTITNLQAYQQGLNPTDFYKGTAPTLTAITDTELPGETGSSATICVQVTGSSNYPMPGAPVIFSTDYGLLSASGGSGVTQEVEVAADSNGYASVTVLEPLWPGVAYTVTAKAETAGHITSIPFTGETGDDDPTIPPVPSLTYPNPNNVNEPTLSVELNSTSFANPAFEQFQPNGPPVKWYLVSTSTGSLTFNDAGSAGVQGWSGMGSYNRIGTVHRPLAGTTWTGSSEYMDTYYHVSSGGSTPDGGHTNTGVFPAPDGANPFNWSNTYTSWGVALTGGGTSASGPQDVSGPPFGPGDNADWDLFSPYATIQSQSTTQMSWAYGNTFSNSNTLSTEYTTQQFQSDVISAVPSTATWDDSDYFVGDTLAWNELADDASSYSVGMSSYKFKCATTGTAPYIFEWYEVFQPDDDTQPIQATHQEWDSANQQSESSIYHVGPPTSGSNGTNGTWYLARLNSTTHAQYPECRWRHIVGIGEDVVFTIQGLPPSISGSATWAVAPSTSGSFTSHLQSVSENDLIVGRNPGTATVTATLPGGATMSTTITIIAPAGVSYKKIAAIPMPIWGLGAKMWGQYTILPTNVSFSGCVYQEEKCPSTDPSGFYQILGKTIWHNPSGQSWLTEPADTNPNWTTIQDDNTSSDLDKAGIGPVNYYTQDYLESFGAGAGGFTWNIPLRYKCANDTDNGVAFPGTVFQIMYLSIEFGSYTVKGTEDGYDTVTGP